MGCRYSRLACRCFILCFIGLALLVLYQPLIDKLDIVYLENIKTRQPLAIDRSQPSIYSTCNQNADRRGPGQKVIAYSVYGDFSREQVARRYLKPLKETVNKIAQAFPGWNVRIYHNFSIDDGESWRNFQSNFTAAHVDLCNATQIIGERNLGDIFAMTWRWLPLLDEMVDLFMSRDADSPLLPREEEAVREWLGSDGIFHAMRDHPMHCVYLLGGLWGVKIKEDRPRIVKAAERILKVNHHHEYDYDQQLLTSHMWPIAETNVVAHDSYCCQYFPKTRPFPSQRQGSAFVGMVGLPIDDDSKPHRCPRKCRPNDSTHWQYC